MTLLLLSLCYSNVIHGPPALREDHPDGEKELHCKQGYHQAVQQLVLLLELDLEDSSERGRSSPVGLLIEHV